MTSAPDPADFDDAERMVRRFARQTNLQLAGRPFRIDRNDAVGACLREVLTALGCREAMTGQGEPGLLAFQKDDAVTLDGRPVPDRGDAAGRLDFARANMPTSRALAASLRESGVVSGLSIGVSMTLEPKTANLALLLRDAGANPSVYAHPDETDPEVAAALLEHGIPVHADRTLAGERERAAALAWLEVGFDVLIDDGSHLVRLAHEVAPYLVEHWIGVAEETTSGLTALRVMSAAGVLATPVIAVNDAATKTNFDNRYGTGQSCVFAIADVLEGAGVSLRDQPALVLGYGPVGQGVAAHLRALGARVAVAEPDAVRALVAAHDGFEVGTSAALALGALVISATGVRGTVTKQLVEEAKIVAVAGGVPGEVDLVGAAFTPIAAHIDAVHFESPGDTLVLDRGGCINITAAEGNPIEVMDLSFATQLAALEFLLVARPAVGVHDIPVEYVDRVAQAALIARGIGADPAAASGGDTDWRSARYR